MSFESAAAAAESPQCCRWCRNAVEKLLFCPLALAVPSPQTMLPPAWPSCLLCSWDIEAAVSEALQGARGLFCTVSAASSAVKRSQLA